MMKNEYGQDRREKGRGREREREVGGGGGGEKGVTRFSHKSPYLLPIRSTSDDSQHCRCFSMGNCFQLSRKGTLLIEKFLHFKVPPCITLQIFTAAR